MPAEGLPHQTQTSKNEPSSLAKALNVSLCSSTTSSTFLSNNPQPLKPPQTKIVPANFGARRILSVYLKTELNSVFGGGVGTCLRSSGSSFLSSGLPAIGRNCCARRKSNFDRIMIVLFLSRLLLKPPLFVIICPFV